MLAVISLRISWDYVDYTDYSDAFADCRVLSEPPAISGPVAPMGEAPLPSRPTTGIPRSTVNVFQHSATHQNGVEKGTINHHQRNQAERSQRSEPAQRRESQNGVPSDAEPPKKEMGAMAGVNRARCPHHPRARWVRFDPSGQAWCDTMDCWDCYRLMHIGNVLGYPYLKGPTRSTTIDQGEAAWISFGLLQRSFIIMVVIEQAVALCKRLGIPEPDLTGEVQRLVPVRD